MSKCAQLIRDSHLGAPQLKRPCRCGLASGRHVNGRRDGRNLSLVPDLSFGSFSPEHTSGRIQHLSSVARGPQHTSLLPLSPHRPRSLTSPPLIPLSRLFMTLHAFATPGTRGCRPFLPALPPQPGNCLSSHVLPLPRGHCPRRDPSAF